MGMVEPRVEQNTKRGEGYHPGIQAVYSDLCEWRDEATDVLCYSSRAVFHVPRDSTQWGSRPEDPDWDFTKENFPWNALGQQWTLT